MRGSWLGLVLAGALVAGCADQRVDPAADPHVAAATAEVAALVAASPVLPGAHESRRAPLAELTRPGQQPASDHLVQRTRWWTAPGSVAQAMAYLRAHPPRALTLSGLMGPNSDGGQGLMLSAKNAAAYVQAQLLLEVIADRPGVAVRADGQAIWLPSRPASGYLRGDVTSVDVTLDRGPAPPLRRILPAAPARRLVALINGLPAWPPGTYSCPMDSGARDHLLFHAPRSSVPVTVSPTGCGTVEIGSGASALRGGADVDRLVRSMLGLR